MVYNKVVKIIKANSNHVNYIFKWLNNKNIKKNLSSNIRVNFISKSLIKITVKRKDQMWYIIKYKEKFAGMIVLDDLDTIDKICNIWYLIGEELFLGKGIMTYSINEVLNKNPFNLDVVTAWCSSKNKSSIKCLQKTGFKKVGTIHQSFKSEGNNNRIIFEKLLNA
mgnify:FL=1